MPTRRVLKDSKVPWLSLQATLQTAVFPRISSKAEYSQNLDKAASNLCFMVARTKEFLSGCPGDFQNLFKLLYVDRCIYTGKDFPLILN